MTSLADVAFAFCREVLGWEDVLALPEDSVMDEAAVIVRGNTDTALYYTDLNAVANVVRDWVAEQTLYLDISGSYTDPYRWAVTVNTVKVVHDDFCHALLAACVEASRKLKGAA